MKQVGTYHIKPFSTFRQNITLITHQGWKKHSFQTVIDVDVTNALKLIKKHHEQTGEKYSFTGWIITCIAHALQQHIQLNAYRKGRKHIVYFDDIDIAIPVERIVNQEAIPMAYILRNAEQKTLNEITKEIRTVQHQNVDDTKQVLGDTFTPLERFAFKSPMFLKKFLLYLLKYLPLLKKKHMGTIGVTAVGMKGKFPGWIVSSGGPPTMLFIISGINKKPGVRNDKVVIRDYLQLTIVFDHDIIDGGPMARFLEDFLRLCEQSYGLKEKTTTSSTT